MFLIWQITWIEEDFLNAQQQKSVMKKCLPIFSRWDSDDSDVPKFLKRIKWGSSEIVDWNKKSW